jgi:signal peptide peptidase SppA
LLADLNVDKFLSNKPLAITLAGLEELRAHITARLALFDAGPRAFVEMRAADRNSPSRGRPRAGAVGVIQIRGAISQHPNTTESGDFASTEDIAYQLRALMADPEVSSILLDIDSPGGTTYGVSELANEIRSARATKPIVAVANSVAASAAYWIASAADQVYVTPGGMVGSIGVYWVHFDFSESFAADGIKPTILYSGEHKVDGNPYQPLGEDVKTRIQSQIAETYDMFIADVAKGRGVPASTVRDGYGQGDILSAKEAKAAGMVDGIYTYEQAVQKAATLRPVSDSGPAAAALNIDFNADELPQADPEGEHEENKGEPAALARLRLRRLADRARCDATLVEV